MIVACESRASGLVAENTTGEITQTVMVLGVQFKVQKMICVSLALHAQNAHAERSDTETSINTNFGGVVI